MPVAASSMSPLIKLIPTASPGLSALVGEDCGCFERLVTTGEKPCSPNAVATKFARSEENPPMASGVAMGRSIVPSCLPSVVVIPKTCKSFSRSAKGLVRFERSCKVLARPA